MRFALAAAAALFALPSLVASAAEYVAPKPGSTFSYGVYEGAETPTIQRTLTVIASNKTGFVAAEKDGSLIRNFFGVAEGSCEIDLPYYAYELPSPFPYKPGTELTDGFVFVIGKDQPFFDNGKKHETWAVRQWTEHGSTWVTRIAPGLGVSVDQLVKMGTSKVPAHDAAKVKACLGG